MWAACCCLSQIPPSATGCLSNQKSHSLASKPRPCWKWGDSFPPTKAPRKCLECNCTAPGQQHYGKDTSPSVATPEQMWHPAISTESSRGNLVLQLDNWEKDSVQSCHECFSSAAVNNVLMPPTLCVSVQVIGVCAFLNIHWNFFSCPHTMC